MESNDAETLDALTADAGKLGIVIIGRNEGSRLIRCLSSLAAANVPIVYVDSGSTDNSVAAARSMKASVVELDTTIPFTAARARNAGLAALMAANPNLEDVQFVDGDCEVYPDWIERARELLATSPSVAAVCGRRRERFPEASIYNRLCDEEWDRPVGATMACGGDVMIRCKAFVQAGRYRESLIAGEEPELCVRLRNNGWLIWRLDADMTLHDANMTRFRQWWRRSVRAGFAFAEVSRIHASSSNRIWAREAMRSIIWGGAIPLVTFAGAAFSLYSLVVLAIYPAQIIRLAARRDIRDRQSWQSAIFMTLGKFAECEGILRYFWRLMRNKDAQLIEYKS